MVKHTGMGKSGTAECEVDVRRGVDAVVVGREV